MEAMPEPAHKPPTRLVLVRHAVTAHTGGKLSGRMRGIDLTDEGRAQAAAVGERLASAPVTVVYASPIERTMQTAQAGARRPHLPEQTPGGGSQAGDRGRTAQH